MPLEFIKSKKGRGFFLAGGFSFRLEKTVKMKKHWKCTNVISLNVALVVTPKVRIS